MCARLAVTHEPAMRLRRRQADDQGGEVNGVEVAAIVVSLTCLALVTWMYMKDADR